jgi:DNA repair exonuclease SbcCD ATPase subunit
MQLSLRYLAQGFLLGMGISLLLFVVPAVQAQGTPTAPRPPTAQEAQWLRDFFDYARQAAGTDASTVNSSVLLLGLFNLLFLLVVLIFIWRGGLKPIFDTVNAERKRASNAEKSETQMRSLKDSSERKAEEYRANTAQSMVRLAETQERTVTILNGLESGQQAQARTDGAVTKIVADVNTHIDDTFRDAKDKLDQAAEHVEKAADTIGDVVTKQHLTSELEPIREELRDIAVTLRKKGDTNPLPPLPEGFTDPSLKPTDTFTENKGE